MALPEHLGCLLPLPPLLKTFQGLEVYLGWIATATGVGKLSIVPPERRRTFSPPLSSVEDSSSESLPLPSLPSSSRDIHSLEVNHNFE